MDVDVEMVHQKHAGRDEVAPAEDLRQTDIIDHPSVRRQNICFSVAMFGCVAFFTVYVVGRIYLQPSEFPFGAGGAITDGTVDNQDKITMVSDAIGKYNNSNGKGWTHKHNSSQHQHINHDHSAGDDSKVKKWLDATVTLNDGIQYEIVERLVHDSDAFTEGLCYVNGRLFESVGLNGKSDLRELNPTTGEAMTKIPMEGKYFGEGLTFVNGQLIQLTWKAKKGFKYDINDLTAPPTEFNFATTRNEGWGLTYDAANNELIESDGSANLHFWDVDTMQQKRKVEVKRMDGSPAKQINELEFWRGRVIANIWFQDVIIVINPETGVVEKEYDFKNLWKKSTRRGAGADVLNGISVSKDPDLLYITGKKWDRMFLIRLLP